MQVTRVVKTRHVVRDRKFQDAIVLSLEFKREAVQAQQVGHARAQLGFI